MFGSVRIARLAGIDLKVHGSFLLIVALGAMQWSAFGPRGAAFGVSSTLLLFGCVLLHELGHSLVARAFGIPVTSITLLPIGGVALMTRRPRTPLHELLIAVAGPLVNVALAALLLGVGVSWLGVEGLVAAAAEVGRSAPTNQTLLAVLLGTNVMLAVFNLIPALPMDGGRVLRALLSMGLGGLKATRISVVVSRVIAAAMFAFAVSSGHLTLGLIAVFVFFGAAGEIRAEQLSVSLDGVASGDAVDPQGPRLPPAATLGEALQTLISSGHTAVPVVHFGRLVGVVARDELMRALQTFGPSGYVTGLMRRSVPQVSMMESLELARARMNEALSPAVAVYDGEHFAGLITERELAQQVLLASAMARRPREDRGDPMAGRPRSVP